MSLVNINTVVMLFHRAVLNLSWYYGYARTRHQQIPATAGHGYFTIDRVKYIRVIYSTTLTQSGHTL